MNGRQPDPRVWISGRFVPEAEATVPVFDRSFLYGDGLFETIRIHHGVPFLWAPHWQRLEMGARALRIRLPHAEDEILRGVHELIRHHAVAEATLRITVSRGVGPRGYSIRGADRPVMVLTLHPAPALALENPISWTLAVARLRIATGDPLSRHKTSNKLLQVLAKAEAEDAGADEAILLNTEGNLAEAASGNLFWIEDGTLCTPPLDAGALAGVTREFTLDLARSLGLRTDERTGPPERLIHAEGTFLTLSTLGIVPATRLDGTRLSASPLTDRLRRAYLNAVNSLPPP